MIREKKFQCIRSEEVLKDIIGLKLKEKKYQLQLKIERLEGLSPLQKLKQGYSYVVDNEHKNIKSICQVKKDDVLKVYVTDGIIDARVHDVQNLDG